MGLPAQTTLPVKVVIVTKEVGYLLKTFVPIRRSVKMVIAGVILPVMFLKNVIMVNGKLISIVIASTGFVEAATIPLHVGTAPRATAPLAIVLNKKWTPLNTNPP